MESFRLQTFVENRKRRVEDNALKCDEALRYNFGYIRGRARTSDGDLQRVLLNNGSSRWMAVNASA